MKKLLPFLLMLATVSFGQNSNNGSFGGGSSNLNGTGAPSNPCSNGTIYTNNSNGQVYSCNAGSWAAVGGGAVSFNTVTAGANANALTETTAGSLVPATTGAPQPQGQLASNMLWAANAPGSLQPPIATNTLSTATVGGSISGSSRVFVRVTYAGPATIVPSAEIAIFIPSGTSTNQVTVNMPTTCQAGSLPATVTGCTVWDSNNTQTEKQQAASNACVNITTATCVINTLGAGATLTYPTTTGVTPPGLQAVSAPDGIVPMLFQTGADGNSYPLAGVDYSALNFLTPNSPGTYTPSGPANGTLNGTFTFFNRVFFNDTGAPPPITNSLVSIHHTSGSSTATNSSAGSGIDDRAFSIHMNDAVTNPNYEQFLSIYTEQYFSNAAFTCSPLSVESCASGGRFTAADFRPTNSGTLANVNIGGLNGADGYASRQSAGTSTYGNCTICVTGVRGYALNGTSGTLNSTWFAGVTGLFADNGGGTSGNGASFYATQTGGLFSLENAAFKVDTVAFAAASGKFAFDSLGTAQERHEGKMYLGGGIYADGPSLAITGSVPITGALSTTQLSGAPTINSVTPTNPGAVTCSYKAVPKDSNGGAGIASASASQSTTCNANLTATNTVAIAVAPASTVGAASYDIYRIVEAGNCNGVACTNGKIGNVAVPTDIGTTPGNVANVTFTDTGQVGDGNTTPSTTLNQTGSIQGFSFATNTNCAGVGTAASPSVATCGSAAAGAFSCATNATGATCVINTTAVTANSEIFIQPTAAEGTRLSVTCNTTADTPTAPRVASKSAGVSFTINLGTVSTNPMCFDYHIVN